MYAVIQTGGKQYRVQAGDVLVVEKLEGEPGAEVAFDRVLMLGGEAGVTVGAPLVDGAVVRATLIETRKAKKIKVFKKIRRQGYRRTNGHRQPESVLRVTGLEGAGQSATWDGTVDLTTRAELVARARGLPFDGGARDEFRGGGAQGGGAASPELDTNAMVEQPMSETPVIGAQTDVDPTAPLETGSMASEGAPAKKPRARKAKAADDTVATPDSAE